MTPNIAVASIQFAVCCVVLTFFVPRLYLSMTTLRHDRDGLLAQRVQQLIMSFAVLEIAGWGFATRFDILLNEPGNRWFPAMGDRWLDAFVWGNMLIAVSVYAWLYWGVERRKRHHA